MRERDAVPDSLAGSLLLAHPGLKDPNFRRAVILLSGHDPDGAMGVIINRPTGGTLGDLDKAFRGGALGDVPVFAGGPVETDRVLICAVSFHDDGEGVRLHFGLEPGAAIALVEEEGDKLEMRAFVGYAGWSAGQLENELAHDTWAVSAIPADMMGYAQDDSLWRRVISTVSPEWRLLADEPDDPARN